MGRASRDGDVATNARKRYYRSAERNLKKAENSSGATAKRYRELARQDFQSALSTYDSSTTQRYSKPIQRLAKEFNYDLEGNRDKRLKKDSKKRKDVIARSDLAKESVLQDPDIRREREARAIFNNPSISSRIMGGLVDVWRDGAVVVGEDGMLIADKTKRIEAIFKYFNVDNYADLLDKIEKITGEKLYMNEGEYSDYETVKMLLQSYVADNALVA